MTPRMFRQTSGVVRRGLSERAVGADPSQQSGFVAPVEKPVWRMLVGDRRFQEANREAIDIEEDRVRESLRPEPRIKPDRWKAGIGTLARHSPDGTVEEHDPESWLDDPEVGSLAAQSLFKRDLKTAKDDLSSLQLRLQDPSDKRRLSASERAEIEGEGSMLQESDPRHVELKRRLQDDDARTADEQAAFDAKVRLAEFARGGVPAWMERRRSGASLPERQAELARQEQSVAAVEESANAESAKVQDQLRRGVRGSDLPSLQQKQAELAQAREAIEAEKAKPAAAAQEVAAAARREADAMDGKAPVPARDALVQALQSANLYGSATSALGNSKDKGISRREDGNWNLPLMLQAPENAALRAIGGAAVALGQKTGARLESAGPGIDQQAIQKVFHDFQQANNLSDEEVKAAWSDLGNMTRGWEEGEKLRVLSDGAIRINDGDPDWLDSEKASRLVAETSAPEGVKAEILRNLPALQEGIAARKAAAYQEVSSRGGFSPRGNEMEPILPFDKFAAGRGGSLVDQVRAYESEYLDRRWELRKKLDEWSAAGKAGVQKADQTIFGAGALALDAVGAGDSAAGSYLRDRSVELAESSARLKEGAGVDGLASAVIEETPSLAVQIWLTRGLGSGAAALSGSARVGQAAGTLGAFATAGGQSAGITYSNEIANGTPREEAIIKARNAGVNTALVTAAFGAGALGGVERVAAGRAAEMTIRDLLQVARTKGVNLATSPELRKFAVGVLASAAGEGAEEGVDEFLGTFLNADPDSNLSDSWLNAVEAFSTGVAIGGAVDVAAGAADKDSAWAARVVQSSPEEVAARVTAEMIAEDPKAPPATPAEVSAAEELVGSFGSGRDSVDLERKVSEAAPEETDALREGRGRTAASDVAAGVKIVRELAAFEEQARESLSIAEANLAEAAASPDLASAEMARVSVDAARINAARVPRARGVVRITRGESLETLPDAEVRALGITRDGKPLKEEELASVGLKKPLVELGADGSAIVLDEAVEDIAAVSPTAASRVTMTESKARKRAVERSTAAPNEPGKAGAAAERSFTVTGRSGTTVEVRAADEVAAEDAGAVALPLGEQVASVTERAPAPGIVVPAQSQSRAEPGGLIGEDAPPEQEDTPLNRSVPAGREIKSTVVKSVGKLKKRLKERVLVTSDPAARAAATDAGIVINPSRLVDEASANGLNEAQTAEWLQGVVDEELRHFAHLEAARALWKSAGRPGDFEGWRAGHYGAMWAEEFAGERAETVRALYGPALDAMEDWQKCMEGLRMMSQQLATGSPTEIARLWTNPGPRILAAIRAALDALKNFAANLSPSLAAEVQAIEAQLSKYEQNSGTGPDSQPEPGVVREAGGDVRRKGNRRKGEAPVARQAEPAGRGEVPGAGKGESITFERDGQQRSGTVTRVATDGRMLLRVDGRNLLVRPDEVISRKSEATRSPAPSKEAESASANQEEALEEIHRLGWTAGSAGPLRPRSYATLGSMRTPDFPGMGNWTGVLDWINSNQREAPSSSPVEMAGRKIDEEWTEFSDESGTLGIPRNEMPQIKAEDRSAMVQFLQARGIAYSEGRMLPTAIKPTQAEFSAAKVDKARAFTGGDRALLVAEGGYLVDGHHQWLAKWFDAPTEPIRTILLKAPINDVLSALEEMPSAESEGAQNSSRNERQSDTIIAPTTEASDSSANKKSDGNIAEKARSIRKNNRRSSLPAQAAEEVKGEMVDPGNPRSAKEIKSDIISQLEAEIAKLPDVTDRSGAPIQNLTVRGIEEEKILRERGEETTATFSIPGNGTFKVKRTSKVLGAILSKVKRMSVDVPTRSKPAKSFPITEIPKDRPDSQIREDDIILGLQDSDYRKKLVKRIGEAQVVTREDVILEQRGLTRADLEGNASLPVEIQAEEPRAPGEVIPPPPAKKARAKRKPKGPNRVDLLINYFRPGALIPVSGGQDRVISFTPGEEGRWSVTVQREGDADARPRIHSTEPSQKLLEKAWRERIPPPAELEAAPLSDGLPQDEDPESGYGTDARTGLPGLETADLRRWDQGRRRRAAEAAELAREVRSSLPKIPDMGRSLSEERFDSEVADPLEPTYATGSEAMVWVDAEAGIAYRAFRIALGGRGPLRFEMRRAPNGSVLFRNVTGDAADLLDRVMISNSLPGFRPEEVHAVVPARSGHIIVIRTPDLPFQATEEQRLRWLRESGYLYQDERVNGVNRAFLVAELAGETWLIDDLHRHNFRVGSDGKTYVSDFSAMRVTPEVAAELFQPGILNDPPSDSLLAAPLGSAESTERINRLGAKGRAGMAGPEIEGEAREQQSAFADAGKVIGRPDLANISDDEAVRAEMDVIDEMRKFTATREKKAAWEKEGRRLAESDESAVVEKWLSNAYSNDGLQVRPEDVVAARVVMEKRVKAAGNDLDRHAENAVLLHGYREARANQARVLAAGTDPFKTPEARHRDYLAGVIYDLPKKVVASIEGRSLSPAAARAEIRKAVKERLAKIEKALKKMGVTFEEITGGQVFLSLSQGAVMKEATKALSPAEKLAVKTIQAGGALADVRRKTGLSEAKIQQLLADLRKQLADKLRAKVASGLKLEDLKEELKGLPAAHLAAADVDAELERILTIGFGLPASVPTARIPKRKPKPVPIEKADWNRPVFTNGLDAFEFNPSDRAEIMRKVTTLREVAGAPGKIELLTGEKKAKAVRLIVEMNKILANYRTSADKVLREGIDADGYRFNIGDRHQVMMLARTIQALDADLLDKGSEYYYSSILSGLQTMMVNASTVVPSVWEATVGRGIEMAVNSIFDDPKAASLGELKYILKAAGPMLSRAWTNAAAAWGSEMPYFEEDILGKAPDLEKFMEGRSIYRTGSISGAKGRIIRIPTRLLLATDEFVRTANACAEVGAMAYRLARANGEKPGTPEFDAFMKKQVNLPGSPAWQMAALKASERTFTAALPGQNDVITGETVPVRGLGDVLGLAAGTLAKLFSYETDNMAAKAALLALRLLFFPFQRVPFNIIRQAARRTLNPVSAIDIAVLFGRNLRIQNGRWTLNAKGEKAEMVERLAQQAQGGLLLLLLAASSAGEGDDDDLEKPILITGSRPFGEVKRGERELGYRLGLGPYEISLRRPDGKRIGFSYGRLEPAATVLGATIDTMREIGIARQGKQTFGEAGSRAINALVSQMTEKTFLRGFSDAQQILSGEADLTKFSAERLAVIVPNLIRQPVRETDPAFREKPDGFVQALSYAIWPHGQLPERRDVYGEVQEKKGTSAGRVIDFSDFGGEKVRPWDEMLWRYRQKHPRDAYAPQSPNPTYTDPATKKPVKMTPRQAARFKELAGNRTVALLKRESFNLEDPTERDIKAFSAVVEKARGDVRKALINSPAWRNLN